MDLGAQVDFQDYSGETSLYKACWTGNANNTEYLCKLKASVNSQNNLGWSPLLVLRQCVCITISRHAAASQGHVECCKILVRNKAKVDILSRQGKPT